MALLKIVCPHCYRESANSLVCTSLGCGKRIAMPVRLFPRSRALYAAHQYPKPADGILDRFVHNAHRDARRFHERNRGKPNAN